MAKYVTVPSVADDPGFRSAGASSRVVARNERTERRRAERRGRLAEIAAGLLLICKGYRVLARRHRSRLGEIDLIAVRGRRIAFVEVKARPSLTEAAEAITTPQALRLGDAAEQWVWRHPAYREHEIGLDAVLIAPWSLPRHRPNMLQHV
jgi:putative endonuclease